MRGYPISAKVVLLAAWALTPLSAGAQASSAVAMARPVGLFEMLAVYERERPAGDLEQADRAAEKVPGPAEKADQWADLQVVTGVYYPYVDPRRRGDPTGPGYNKFQSRWQVVDWGSTNIRLGLDALAPAAVESGGIPSAPTTLSPGFLWCQNFGNGIQLQGSVGQNFQALSRWAEQLDSLRALFRFECPLLPAAEHGVVLFVQALAHCRASDDNAYLNWQRGTTFWEFTPGVQWRFRDKASISLGASRWNLVTCSWQF